MKTISDLLTSIEENTLIHFCGGYVTRFETISRINSVNGKKMDVIMEGIMCLNCGEFIIKQKDDKTSKWQNIVSNYNKQEQKTCKHDFPKGIRKTCVICDKDFGVVE